MKKTFLAIGFSIIIALAISLSSCNPFQPTERPRHVCTFDTETVVTRQDCDSDGIIVRSCICGQQRTEILSAPGHVFGDWEIKKNSDCTTFGYESRACENCKKTETRIIENTGHDYRVSEETIDGTPYNRYTCSRCDESFLLQSGVAMPDAGQDQIFLANRSKDFSFQIISSEGEEYIREHLKIVKDYFDSEEFAINYSLTEIGGGCWVVSPEAEYDGGSTYVAKRSGGVIFSRCGFSNLAFSIKSDETYSVVVSEAIVFVTALEEEFGGYYPYNLDFSERSGEYFLTLEAATGLKVGDLICVGDAKNAEEYLEGGNNTFGIIQSITTLNDGRTLLMLSIPSISQVFESLKIYTESISKFEKIDDGSDEDDTLTAALYSDSDFVNLISATYSATEEHLKIRGLTPGATFADFISSIKISADDSIDPALQFSPDGNFIYAKIAINGEGNIPVMSNSSEIGVIQIEFSASVSINSLSMKMWIEEEKFGSDYSDELEFSFEIREDVEFAFSFDIGTFIDYSAEEELFVLDSKDDHYHYRGCAALYAEENQSAVSIFDMISLMHSGEHITECRICHPVTDMAEDMIAIDTEEATYHRPGCREAGRIPEQSLILTEREAKNLNEYKLTPCSVCSPKNMSRRSFESRLADRISRGDYVEYRDEFGRITGIMERNNTEIDLGEYIATLGGIDEEIIKLSFYFDFHINASMHYEYKASQSFIIGYRNTENGAKHYNEITESKLAQNTLTSIGMSNIYMGNACQVKMQLCGFGQSVNAEFDTLCEIYAKADGGVIMNGDEITLGDTSAYCKSGITLKAFGSITLPSGKFDRTEIEDQDTVFFNHTEEQTDDEK